MPLVAWSVLAYSVTLIITLGSGLMCRVVVGVMALSVTVIGLATRRKTSALIGAIVAAAVLAATATATRDAQCATALAAASQWQAEFETDAHEGELTHAALSIGDCVMRGTLLLEQGSVLGGERALVRGRATADARGLFVEHAIVTRTAPASGLLALRAATGRRIDRIFRDDAPMARALVIADMSGIPAVQRDRYATAGLVHMLSVSGLHVGIVALALELLASILRLPVTPARLATLLLLAVYVAAIGAPPPAVRAAVMLGALLLSRVAQRPTSPWAILALGAVAPLWSASTALDLGWQLSVAGTASLIAGGALSRRIVPESWAGWRGSLAKGGLISVVATAVTAPLVAWAFGRVSLLGPVTNLLADPVMALLQPLLFVALAIPIHAVESMAADASHVLLLAFDGIARVAASVPGAAPSVLPSVLGAVAAAVASVALIVACLARHPWRGLAVGGAALAALIVGPLAPQLARAPELHMIDVGQGDAFALRTGRGRWVVVDAGRSWDGGDAGRSTVVPYLSRLGGSVALFVMSHPHADHVGGAASLFSLMRPARFLDPGFVGTSPPYRAALVEARADAIAWQRVRPGDSLVVDDIVLSMLAPDSSWAVQLADANLASSVLLARVGGYRVLFTGDAEGPEEEWLLEHAREALHADVLKVAHHGSSTSTTPRFLDAVHPRVALVSVGAHNRYGHPGPEVIQALQGSGAATFRTDRLGTVVLRFLREGIDVDARGAHSFLPNQVIR